jgi:hypothetical protein
MVAGMFRNSGHFMGSRLLAPTAANPLGFYEDHDVTNLNNKILDCMFRWPVLDFVRRRFAPKAHYNVLAYWLAAPERIPNIRLPSGLLEEMKGHLARQPFCYKDPRFSVTLPYWQEHLPENTVFLVIFREPAKTVESIVRLFRNDNLPWTIGELWAYRSWWRNYARLLKHARDDKWLFVHYDQVVSSTAVDRISAFVDGVLCTKQLDTAISGSRGIQPSQLKDALKCQEIYELLCARSRRDLASGTSKSVRHGSPRLVARGW